MANELPLIHNPLIHTDKGLMLKTSSNHLTISFPSPTF